MKRRLCLAVWATATVAGCIVPPDPINQPGMTGAGGSAGTGGPGGGGGVGGGLLPGPAPRGAWAPITGNLTGKPSDCGNLGLVAAKPDEDLLIASVALQGLWKGAPGSTDWTPLGPGAGGDIFKNRSATLIWDPLHPRTFWQVGIYGPCLYKTTDNGATFTQVGNVDHCDSVSIDFADPERKTMLAGGHENRKVLRSTDGGNTWTDIGGNIPPDTGFTGWALLVTPQIHLLATWSHKDAGIFRTTDGGATWTRVFSGTFRSKPLVSSDGIYWLLNHLDNNTGLVKSTDQGATWTKVAGSEVLASNEQGIIELSDGKFVGHTRNFMVISETRGTTWRQLSPRFPYEDPAGAAFSRHRNAYYIWRWDCNAMGNPVSPDAIMRWDIQ